MMKPCFYGPLCKAVFLPDSRGLLSTNQTRAHRGSAPTGLGPRQDPRGWHCPPRLVVRQRTGSREEDRLRDRGLPAEDKHFTRTLKNFFTERLSEDNGESDGWGDDTPSHSWMKGRDEDTRGLYTSPENTGGTAGDGPGPNRGHALARISTARQGWAPATPSAWGSQQRPVS